VGDPTQRPPFSPALTSGRSAPHPPCVDAESGAWRPDPARRWTATGVPPPPSPTVPAAEAASTSTSEGWL
jgi:hypothetical protein